MSASYEESMQIIIVENNTDETLYNLKLTHNGNGSNDYIIKKLKGNSKTKTSLFTLKAKEDCDLIVECEYKGVKKSIVAYDKLNKENRRYIVLNLRDENAELKIDMDFQSIYD